ncbi:MAG: hypothetical protein HOK67_10155 [Deltaproteobacteria bacterium]|jgi:hypothetical protein|nr:hypothetical protein [Deltaproteobacteria bacterium]MBT4265750.1 hypothetical protein [Deltaproteobacteria bacterium]MBT4640289.1 hypothetical protein [Deltaproteobacteria bacterium]MBT6500258.1 hypothetical protein [Deltaproteobacteria bacterium]MBT6615248.1 hypothetical protein [Deltaproteobacteria bacterium]
MQSQRLKTLIFVCVCIICIARFSSSYATPFPIKGEIYDGNDQQVGIADVYPRYVEIFDNERRLLGKVGILVEKGIAKLFLVDSRKNHILVGYANGGKIFDEKDEIRGSYFWTPTWSFVYNLDGKRAGKVKCIAWPRVCAVGVGGYLLNLFQGEK